MCEYSPTPTTYNLNGRNDKHIQKHSVVYNEIPMDLREISKSPRVIISEKQDGFWKIVTETFKIHVKMGIEAWGKMGGQFGNWLVENGFKSIEKNYTYDRDGETVIATTITTCHPTKQGGVYFPTMLATEYNGKFMVLGRGDIIQVWYTEKNWSLSNSIYAKGFATDSQHKFRLGPHNWKELIFRQNKLGKLGDIKNSSGYADMQLVGGGFGQMDSSNYTGLAIYLQFQCINGPTPNGPCGDQNSFCSHNKVEYWDAYACIGTDGWNDTKYYFNAWNGYGAGYPLQEQSFDCRVSYSSLLPSDPDFITGGDNYVESITNDLFDRIISLEQQVNDMLSRMNVSDLTGGLFSLITMIPSFPNMVQGVIEVIRKTRDIFNKQYSKLVAKGMKFNRNFRKRYIKMGDTDIEVPTPTLSRTSSVSSRSVDFENMFTDDEIVSLLHSFGTASNRSSIRSTSSMSSNVTVSTFLSEVDEIQYLDPIIISRIMDATPPVITRMKNVKPKNQEVIYATIKRNKIDEDSLIEFNQINDTITLLEPNKKTSTFKFPGEIIDDAINKMGTGYSRSLFSLNIRKQFAKLKHKFDYDSIPYEKLVNDMLNDHELIDISKKFNSNILTDLFEEFKGILQNALA
uniref:VP4 n=1 Tax=Crocidura shantungensis seadorna-like virus 2 TaxID=3139546 RepID=A0AB38ZK58_9REOV